MLLVDHISKAFSLNGRSRPVLEDIHFSVRQGELICIIGKSGCGKSTLLKIIAGFLAPSSGTVFLNKRPVRRPGPDRCFVFQEDALFPWLTVEENIAFGIERKSRKDFQKEIDRFLSLVGLTEFRHYLPREISGGMRQRVAIARVLILKPQVLLMDEPFGALDAYTRGEMQQLLLHLWSQLGQTILFVTHDVNEAVILADRILVMGRCPGQIHREISVSLSRPRKKYEDQVSELTQGLSDILSEKREN
jgi:NitT/TauT family transport system ATP-binding protein